MSLSDAKSAQQDFKTAGTSAILTVTSSEVYDETTRKNTVIEVEYPVYLVALDTTKQQLSGNTLIRAGDILFNVASLDIPVGIECGKTKLTLAGKVYQIVMSEELAPQNISILWTVLARR